MLSSRDFQRLGDLAAPPPVALDRRDQRAVIDFAARLSTWSEELRGRCAAQRRRR